MLLRPGAHGFVVPHAWTLADELELHAEIDTGGCHIFLDRSGGGACYYGFYRIVRSDTPLTTEEWVRVPRAVRLELFF